MSLFKILCNDYLEEMASPRGAITIPPLEAVENAPKPEWINKFTESDINPKTGERRKPNPRDGKHTGEDAWNALQLFIKSGHGAGKVYADNARMQASIYDFLKHTVGWASSPSEKWMKTIGNYLYGLNLITQTPDDTGNNAAGEALPQASSEDIQEIESEEGEDSGEENVPQVDEGPGEGGDMESMTAGLDLDPVEETILGVITSLGGKEVTNAQILSDPSTPDSIKLHSDSRGKLREILGKMAKERGVISRGDTGWNVTEVKSSEDSDAVFDRDEDGTDYGAIDTINKYASDFGGSGRANPFLDHVELKDVFIDSFKVKGLITD
jgi:hypothetical protein